MGVRNVLVEGLSGAGKTTVAEELQRRGHHVIHGDRNFAYYGDPETGAPLDWPPGLGERERTEWGYARWIWPVDKVRALIADRSNPITFFCGSSRNSHHFIHLFDAVFFLDLDSATLNRRLSTRPDDEFGGKPIERELTTRLNETREYVPAGAVVIDSTRPLDEVVEAILARAGV